MPAIEHKTLSMEAFQESVAQETVGQRADGRRQYIFFGPFQLQTKPTVVLKDGLPIFISPKATRLLLLLVQRASRLVTYEEIKAYFADPDNATWIANIKRTARKLSVALEDFSPSNPYIEHVKDEGYIFVAKLAVSDVAPLPNRQDRTRIESRNVSPATRGTLSETVRPAVQKQSTRALDALTLASLLVAGVLVGSGLELLWLSGAPARHPFVIPLFLFYVPIPSTLLLFWALQRLQHSGIHRDPQ